MPDDDVDQPSGAEPRRYQFGIRSLFFLMLVAAIAAGIFAALVRAVQQQSDITFFIILVVAAPVGFMVLVSLWKSAEDYLASRRTERERRDMQSK